MPSFYITGRRISAITPVTVDAVTREEAIQQVVDTAAEGEQIEIYDAVDLSSGRAPAEGATGVTGTMRVAGPAARAQLGPNPVVAEPKPTRAQLNEMSKEELLEVAAREGAEVNQNWNKADIVDAIVKHK